MSEHFFGLGDGYMPAAADEVARKHGACLVNYTEPHGKRRHWFACPNRGEPFDSSTANAVMADIEAAGIVANGRNGRRRQCAGS